MPRYDYVCVECALVQERSHSMFAPVPRCKYCNAVLRRTYHTLSFNMQGHGASQDDPITQYQFKHLYRD